MPVEKRIKGKLPSPGPFLAEVTNHLDPLYMGGLEVAITQGLPANVTDQGNTAIVKYMSPFYGSTSLRHEGTNSSDFNDVQKSYGWWAVPPDVGTTVMVIFIDGDPNQGYWMGCIPDQFQNHMVPGIAASKQAKVTEEQRRKYGTDYLPVAEFHKGSNNLNNPNVDKIGKPVHPFADRLLAQGLLMDTTRGVTSSSARREVPSSVFGISTPGPVDTSPGAKRGKIGYNGGRTAPVSRLGGTTFVMDDGDVNGQDEYVRIRTRTGHQILMHNSQDLIYIANSKGSAWIEMTSNGKIDIFAEDSVSIHTKNDFNFRADRDINLEAGRNINIKADKNMETNIHGYYYLMVDDEAKISIRNDKHETVGQSSKISVGQNLDISTAQNIKVTASGEMNLGSVGDMKQGTSGSFHVGAAGSYFESASEIHMNGPGASPPETADDAETPVALTLYNLPNRDPSAGWANGNLYKGQDIKSIMHRVPTHEPWDQHENINPNKFTPAATDASLGNRSANGVAPNTNTSEGGATSPQEPANQPDVLPGTCDKARAAEINLSAGKAGQASINAACAKLGVTSPYMVATMLGVAGGESLWKLVTENFNYKADRLLQVFPSVFKGDMALAQQYAGNPNNSLPEFLYGYQTAKGKGLGNTQPGDGFKYIGRGYIGLTGRANYAKFSKLLYERKLVDSPTALIDNPELVNDPNIAGLIVVIYFLTHPTLLSANQKPGPDYFEKGYRAVGFCTPDIHAKKQGYYECFLGQLMGKTVGSSDGIVTDGSGQPVRTGSGG